MEQKSITQVVAALIWDSDRFLICQRPAHKARGLLWEFVGGKVEPGETKQQALLRECREELDISLRIGDEFMTVVHEYPDITVELTLFNAVIGEGTPKMLEHHDLQWITPEEIPQYEFCPADKEILEKIILSCPKGLKRYYKLVRDRIPEIIDFTGQSCTTEVLSQEEYLRLLDEKLTEELDEYQESKSLEELADLLEVMEAVVKARGCTTEELLRIKQEKYEKRGGFEQRILLKEVL